ncbi:MAG: PAS domain S-box protein [Cyanobacteriota bacterium]|nr:PAS domain S-box protein [Cyanobacteriota bacterium]
MTVTDAIACMSATSSVEIQESDFQTQGRSSCVFVIENKQLIGILTESTILHLIRQSQPLDALQVCQVMDSPVITLQESDFSDIFSAINLLQDYKIRHLPILDRQERVIGLVTSETLLSSVEPKNLENESQILAQKVEQLEAEKKAWQDRKTLELEKEVEARTMVLEAQARREKLVVEIATQIRASLSLQAILDTTVEQIRQALNCDRVNIWKFDVDWHAQIVAESTDSPVSLVGEQIDNSGFQQEPTQIYHQGLLRVIPDIYTTEMSDAHREMLACLHTRATILVPLLCGYELWGLINVSETQQGREWEPEDVELLQALSMQLAIAIQQATTYQQLAEELKERRQAETRLRESEKRYASLATAAPVGIFRTDAVGNCTYVNHHWTQITGLTPETASQDGWQNCLHPEDRHRVALEWEQSLKEQRPSQLEYRIQRPDGSIRWVYGQLITERDSQGNVVSYLGTITDISDRKLAESTLKNIIEGTSTATTGDEFFSALVSHIAQAVNTSYVLVSEIIGEKLQTLAFWANGQLQPSITYHFAESPCEKVLKEGFFCCCEGVSSKFPQLRLLAEIKAESYLGVVLTDRKGQPLGKICVLDKQPINPVTAQNLRNILQVFAARASAELQRKRSDEALQQLNATLEERINQRTQQLQDSQALLQDFFDNAHDLIQSVLVEDGQFEYVNRAWRETLGYTEAEVETLTIFDILHPDYHDYWSSFITQMQDGLVCRLDRRLELIVLTKDRREIILEGSIDYRRDQNYPVATRSIFRDVTKRNQYEAQLLNLSERLQLAIRSARMGIWDWNVIDDHLTWDERMFELYGVKAANFTHSIETWQKALHPEDVAPVNELVQQALREKTEFETEFRVIHPDGSIHWIQATAAIKRNAQGQSERMIGVNVDISDYKQAHQQRQQLIQELEAFKLALDQSAIVAITDPTGTITYVNDRFCEISGYSRKELLGQTHSIIKSDYHSPEYFQELWEAITRGEIWRGEICNQAKNGQLYWVMSTIVPFLDASGQPYQYLAIRFEITTRKQAQVALQQSNDLLLAISEAQSQFITAGNRLSIFEGLLDSLLELTDSEYGFIGEVFFQPDGSATMEESFLKIRGMPDLSTHRIPNITSNLSIESDNNSLFGAVILTGKPVIINRPSDDLRSLRTPEGFPPLTVFLGLPFFRGSTLVGIVGIANRSGGYDEDIIEHLQPFLVTCGNLIEGYRLYRKRREAEAQLQHTNEELAHATRLKDEFLANMSHELRTPLNAILGMTEGLKEQVFGNISPQQLHTLETIEQSGSHLLELINDILDVAKIESGQIELDCTPVSVYQLCESSLSLIEPHALRKQIQLETKLPFHLPQVCLDERRIRQVLINLLDNAIKFTPKGGTITLEVSLIKNETSEQEKLGLETILQVTIIDTGIGIAPENLPKLFQPFIQIDSALNRKYEGTGLGLALVKRIVELHGGKVGVESQVGVGSQFTIALPAIVSALSEPETPAHLNRIYSQPQPLVSPSILLVEDNEANISTMTKYLEAKGYRLSVARNGEEAIALIQQQTPDLIIMDIQMPGMDGLEAIKHIRAILKLVDIPIIAVTALVMSGDRERCLEAGANEYLSKPVKLKELAGIIKQYTS